jgi:hypothetical protein
MSAQGQSKFVRQSFSEARKKASRSLKPSAEAIQVSGFLKRDGQSNFDRRREVRKTRVPAAMSTSSLTLADVDNNTPPGVPADGAQQSICAQSGSTVLDGRRLLGGIGRTTLYAVINSGELKVIKAHRRTLTTHQALQAYLDAPTALAANYLTRAVESGRSMTDVSGLAPEGNILSPRRVESATGEKRPPRPPGFNKLTRAPVVFWLSTSVTPFDSGVMDAIT